MDCTSYKNVSKNYGTDERCLFNTPENAFLPEREREKVREKKAERKYSHHISRKAQKYFWR
jgi:hypothetical protein